MYCALPLAPWCARASCDPRSGDQARVPKAHVLYINDAYNNGILLVRIKKNNNNNVILVISTVIGSLRLLAHWSHWLLPFAMRRDGRSFILATASLCP